MNSSEVEHHIPRGFLFNAVRAGIKASGKPDFACAIAPAGATAAAMFTRNRIVAAPLIVDREHLVKSETDLRALVVNAGNANCATGEPGIEACRVVCGAAALKLDVHASQIFPSSTGIIGVPLPVGKLVNAMPDLVAGAGDTAEHVERFTHAIMTTDTRPKVESITIATATGPVNIMGIAKGAGMIHPNMATMLVYLFTDAAISAVELQALLRPAVEESFNCISIDGDTSTNDTVLLMASGASQARWESTEFPHSQFREGLNKVCSILAHKIVDDGEGVTHVVTLDISGARTREDALRVAKSIAHSPLVKTAWAGMDPNWGRILAATGYSGVPVTAEKITIRIGPHLVFDRGVRAGGFDEQAVHEAMRAREFTVTLDLGEGPVGCRFLTTDLTAEYVHINADYST
ncbi:MAG TPA: bifunctional glutamate N-acetyltransferase/amino-acid acetyltransferase ArgJ [Acidobacteriaceae bacterium]|jgi:glutamate N-acetyltransferase/amino-acid N-acetyltransferase|nr:bifunctional glutamate N-acetyltransferase/amino-acid acetyltransferase ArgJ [Acidobacteriaceae bacterium]